MTWRGRKVGKWVVPGAVLAARDHVPVLRRQPAEVPIFGPFPEMSTMVVMMIFTMMALGLNIVVGYAGLLDLGYVAFYAIGAYMAGWFASQQFASQNLDFGAVGLYKGDDRLPPLDLARAARRRARDRARRRAHRPADAAPARRLPRDRHARLRRDPAADRAQRRQPLRLQPHERHGRDHADRRAGLRQLGCTRTWAFLPTT